MEDHKSRLDKEYESLMQKFSKDLEQIQLKHQRELERKLKDTQVGFLLPVPFFPKNMKCFVRSVKANFYFSPILGG